MRAGVELKLSCRTSRKNSLTRYLVATEAHERIGRAPASIQPAQRAQLSKHKQVGGRYTDTPAI